MKRILIFIHYIILCIIFVSLNTIGKNPSWKPVDFSMGTFREILEASNPVRICVVCADANPKLYSRFFQDLLPPQNIVFVDATGAKAFIYDSIKQEWILGPPHKKKQNERKGDKESNKWSFHGVIIGVDKPITSSSYDKFGILYLIQEAQKRNVPILIQFNKDLSILNNISVSRAPVIISRKYIYPVSSVTARKELIQRAIDFRNGKMFEIIGKILRGVLSLGIPIFVITTLFINFWFSIILILWLLSISWLKVVWDRHSLKIFPSVLVLTYVGVIIYAFMGWEIPPKSLLGFIVLAIYGDIKCRKWRQRLMEEPLDEHTLFIRFKSEGALAEKASRLTQSLRPYLSFLTANELKNFRFYTDHGLAHVLYTLKKEAELLNWHTPKGGKLSPFENYILYCATLIHDIGLYPFKPNDRNLSTEMIRAQHAERVSEFIAYKKDELILPPEELKIIGEVAKHHSRKYNIENLNTTKHSRYGKVRMDLLAAILRIADACDHARWRLPPKEIEKLACNILPEEEKNKTLEEYKTHSYVDDVQINLKEGKIKILSLSPKDKIEIVEETKNRLQEEVNSVKDVFHKYGIKLDKVEIIPS